MNTNTNAFSATATEMVARFGNSAHDVIGAYREGGERLADKLEQRWKSALKETRSKLTPETRRNAAAASPASSVAGRMTRQPSSLITRVPTSTMLA